MSPSLIWITASCSVLWAPSYLYIKNHLSESFRWDLWAIFSSLFWRWTLMAFCDVRLLYMSVSINKVIRIPWLGFPTFLSSIHHSSPLRLTMQFQTLKSSRSTLQFLKTNQHLKYRKTSKVSEANIIEEMLISFWKPYLKMFWCHKCKAR